MWVSSFVLFVGVVVCSPGTRIFTVCVCMCVCLGGLCYLVRTPLPSLVSSHQQASAQPKFLFYLCAWMVDCFECLIKCTQCFKLWTTFHASWVKLTCVTLTNVKLNLLGESPKVALWATFKLRGLVSLLPLCPQTVLYRFVWSLLTLMTITFSGECMLLLFVVYVCVCVREEFGMVMRS